MFKKKEKKKEEGAEPKAKLAADIERKLFKEESNNITW